MNRLTSAIKVCQSLKEIQFKRLAGVLYKAEKCYNIASQRKLHTAGQLSEKRLLYFPHTYKKWKFFRKYCWSWKLLTKWAISLLS